MSSSYVPVLISLLAFLISMYSSYMMNRLQNKCEDLIAENHQLKRVLERLKKQTNTEVVLDEV